MTPAHGAKQLFNLRQCKLPVTCSLQCWPLLEHVFVYQAACPLLLQLTSQHILSKYSVPLLPAS